jgi:hypothetical protein
LRKRRWALVEIRGFLADNAWLAILAVLTVLFFGGLLLYVIHGEETDAVTRYCEYGAISEAQLNGCKDHVDADYVRSHHTNAARYGQGVLTDCLADSGPFCNQGR